ncbi:MAG: lipid-A-disaccharide synthase [candidate division Zixibacteria bacterium]|nr:lipid-A-disaccharide synthase [candidate division Zixibacteria bacterium]
MDAPLLFISAGDPSGDNAVSRVVQCLRQKRPGLRVFGLGGPRLRQLGQEQLAEPSALAVLGFWEVARKYLFFRKLFYDCVNEIRQRRPKAILLVDYPGFNLRLARAIRPLGIPIIYYISPQVWAWGKGRLGLIRDCVDRMLVILPFEEAFYREHGIACKFVGHYLLEDIPPTYVSSAAPGGKQIALLPGSRRQEVERILPLMLDAASALCRSHGMTAAVAAMSGTYDYDSICKGYVSSGVKVIYDDPRRVMYESDIVLTASGTATLEAGIIGRPMVVVYRTGSMTYLIARNLVKLDKIALVNLVLDDKVVPELIQNEANSRRMVEETEKYLLDDECRLSVTRSLARVPSLLGGLGASAHAAEAIGEYL